MTLALAVVAGLVVFVGAMRDNINAAGNGVADTFAALAGEGGTGGGAGGGESDEPVPDPNGVAFAVYSEDENSLDFYKRDRLPEVGTQFNGKTVTEVYEGIEDTGVSKPSWYSRSKDFASSTVMDSGIAPASLSFWFDGAKNLKLANLESLDLAQCRSLYGTFRYCRTLTDLKVSTWDTSSITDMRAAFQYSGNYKNPLSLSSIQNWNTSNVLLFSDCFYEAIFTDLDLSRWNMKSCKQLNDMFAWTSSNSQVNVSGWVFSNGCSLNSALYHANCKIIGLETWDVSGVVSMSYTFEDFNFNNLDLSNWDVSNVKVMVKTFCPSMFSTPYSIDVSMWNAQKASESHKDFNLNAPNVIPPSCWA